MHKRQLTLTILAVLVLIATITASIAGSITAAASGVGSPGGSGGNASSAPAAAKLIHGDRRDIVGYRFTVYSSAGSMLGHPSDIMLPDSWHVRETFYGYINDDTGHRLVDKVNLSRAEKSSDATANKKTYSSPMTLRKEVYSNGAYQTYYRNASGNWVLAETSSDIGKAYVYYWDTIKSNSTLGFYRGWDYKMTYDTTVFFENGDAYQGWLNKQTDSSGTYDNVTGVKKLCGVTSISDDQYVFVEPLIMGHIEDPSDGGDYYYAMTISEWGLFQCDATIQIFEDNFVAGRNGWSQYPSNPFGVQSEDWYLWICNFVSAQHASSIYVTTAEAHDKCPGNSTFWGAVDTIAESHIDTANYPTSPTRAEPYTGPSLVSKISTGSTYIIAPGARYIPNNGNKLIYNTSKAMIETMMGCGVYYDMSLASKVSVKARLDATSSTSTSWYTSFATKYGTMISLKATDSSASYPLTKVSNYEFQTSVPLTSIDTTKGYRLCVGSAQAPMGPVYYINPSNGIVYVDFYTVTIANRSNTKVGFSANPTVTTSTSKEVIEGTTVNFYAQSTVGTQDPVFSDMSASTGGKGNKSPLTGSGSSRSKVVNTTTRVETTGASEISVYPHLNKSRKYAPRDTLIDGCVKRGGISFDYGTTSQPWDGYTIYLGNNSTVQAIHSIDECWDADKGCMTIPAEYSQIYIPKSSSKSQILNIGDAIDSTRYTTVTANNSGATEIDVYYYSVTVIAQDGIKGVRFDGGVDVDMVISDVAMYGSVIHAYTADPENPSVPSAGILYPESTVTWVSMIGTPITSTQTECTTAALSASTEIYVCASVTKATVITTIDGVETAVDGGYAVYVKCGSNTFRFPIDSQSRMTFLIPTGGSYDVYAARKEGDPMPLYVSGITATEYVVPYYTLTVTTDGRTNATSTNYGNPNGVYLNGTTVNLRATPVSGYTFREWEDQNTFETFTTSNISVVMNRTTRMYASSKTNGVITIQPSNKSFSYSPKPVWKNDLTYSGDQYSVGSSTYWSSFTPTYATIGGTTSATIPGTYTASFTAKGTYNTTYHTSAGMTATLVKGIDWDTNSNGTVTATSSNTSVATVSVSNKNVTVTAKKAGTATITIKLAGGSNYTACSATFTVTVTGQTVSRTWKILPRPITITGGSKSKTYDGTALAYNYASLSAGSIASNQTATYSASGTITNVGSTNNVPSAVIKDAEGNNVTQYYTVTKTNGTLIVNKRPITITADSAVKAYDGTPLTKKTASVTSGSLVSGHVITPTISGSQTNVGSSTNALNSVVIKNASGTDVTANYNVIKANGTLTVTGSDAITITAGSKTKTYDGTALTYNYASLTSGTLAPGHTATYSAAGTITNAGTAENVPSVVIKDANGNNVTSNYTIVKINGTLTVNKRPITIKADNASKVYDGTPLTKNTVTVTSGSLVSGHSITPTITGTQTNVGSSDNTLTAVVIKNASGTDVTANYNITKANGTLTVTGKEITITGGSKSKTYDGTALTYNNASLTAGSLVAGHTATYSAAGTITNVGTANNVPSAVIKDASGNDVTSNYIVTKVNGVLTVNKRNITVKADNASKVYDGTALTKKTVTVTSGTLVSGHVITPTITGSQTNVGSSVNTLTAVVIKNASGTDVTANYNITKANGTLTVTGKEITITSDSAAKVYDGTPLTKKTATVTSGSLVSGHTITPTITGTQTNVGSSANTLTAVVIKNASGTDVTANYIVTLKNGTLTVTGSDAITITAGSKTKTYDGTALTYNYASLTSGTLAPGHTATYSAAGTITNAGTAENVPSVVIKDANGNDVTANYTIVKVNGVLTVNKRNITVKADNASKVYDGTPLTKNTATVTSGSLVSGHSITPTITGTQTNVGSSANTLTAVVIKNASGTDVTANYNVTKANGNLTVTGREITITGGSKSKTYDGTALTYNSASLTAGSLVTGHTATYSAAGTITNVGTANNVPSVIIKDASGNDVTSNYIVTKVNGILTVNKRNITVKSDNASKVYDGTALTKKTVTVTSGTLVSGHVITPTITGSQTNVGSSANTLTAVVIKNASGTDVTANYNITKANGTLTVTGKEITITGGSKSKTYDGTPLTYNSASLTSGSLVTGHTATYSATGTITDAGTGNNVPSVVIKDASGNNVTSNYIITKVNGTLTVNKRVVSYTAGSKSKVYDGTALTYNSASKTSGSLVTGHTATYTVSGSQTAEGSSANKVTAVVIKDASGNDVSKNYTVNKIDGTLTVTPATYTITYVLNGGTLANGYDAVYDNGTYHRQKNPTVTKYNGMDGYNAWFYVDKPTRTGYTFAGWTITGMDTCSHKFWFNSTTNTFTLTTMSSTEGGELPNNQLLMYNLRRTSGTVTFTANWTPIDYTVTLTHDDYIKSVSGGGTYHYGDTVTINAVPKDMVQMTSNCGVMLKLDGTAWSGQNIVFVQNYGKSTQKTWTAAESTIRRGYYAADLPFNETPYKVLVNGVLSNAEVISNIVTVYGFDKWGGKYNSTNCTYTFTMPAANVTERAEGHADVYRSTDVAISFVDPPIDYFNLYLNGDAGIKTLTGAGKFKSGDTAAFSAAVKDGYRFLNWTDDRNGGSIYITTLSGTTVMSTTRSYTAHTVPNKVTIDVKKDDHEYFEYPGEITLVDENGNVITTSDSGNPYTKETDDPVPNGTYKVYADGEDTGVVVVIEDGDVRTTVDYYTVTATGDDGIESTTGSGVYIKGTTVVIDAETKPEKTFVEWDGTIGDENVTYPEKQNTITVTDTVVVIARTSVTTYDAIINIWLDANYYTAYGTGHTIALKNCNGAVITRRSNNYVYDVHNVPAGSYTIVVDSLPSQYKLVVTGNGSVGDVHYYTVKTVIGDSNIKTAYVAGTYTTAIYLGGATAPIDATAKDAVTSTTTANNAKNVTITLTVKDGGVVKPYSGQTVKLVGSTTVTLTESGTTGKYTGSVPYSTTAYKIYVNGKDTEKTVKNTSQTKTVTTTTYAFSKWTGQAGTLTSASTSFTVTGTTTMTAYGKNTATPVSTSIGNAPANTTINFYTLHTIVEVDDVEDETPFPGDNAIKTPDGEHPSSTDVIVQEGDPYEVSAKDNDDDPDYTPVETGTMDDEKTVIVQYYTVKTSGDSGISSTTGSGTYRKGTSCTINATVKSGYVWKTWEGTYTKTTKQYTFTVVKSAVEKARTKTTINIEILVDDEDPDDTFDDDDNIVVDGEEYPIPPDGEIPVLVDTDEEHDVEVPDKPGDDPDHKVYDDETNEPETVVVRYYRLTLTGDVGIASTSGSGVYITGTKVNVSASVKSGYTFSKWSKVKGDSLASASAASTTVTITKSTAHKAVTNTTLVIKTSVDGTVSKPYSTTYVVVNDTKYTVGTDGTVTLTLQTGSTYTIKAMTGSGDTTCSNTYTTGTLTAAKTVTIPYFTITTKKDTGITSTSGDGTYLKGTTATINAVVASGYGFTNWTGTSNYTKQQQSFTVNSKVTETAHAAIITAQYKVNYYLENKNGGYTLHKTDTLTGRTDIDITVSPAYTFSGFTAFQTKVSNPSATVSGCGTVTARVLTDGTMHVDYYYNRSQITITYVLNGGTYNGSTSNVVRTYDIGTTITLINPTAPNGKTFNGWYLNMNGNNYSGCIGMGGDSYLLNKSITVYACYSGMFDIGISAQTIYGSINTGTVFTSAAAILNHSNIDIIPSMHVNAVAKVYRGSTLINTYTINDVCVPALKRNLAYVTIPTTGWSTASTYKIVWSLDFSSATISDTYTANNSSTIGNIVPGGGSVSGNSTRPDYSTTPDPNYDKNTLKPGTAINRCVWSIWTYTNNKFVLNKYSDQMRITLILKPENENGLRSYVYGPYKLHNYTTRSGYGFSIHTTNSFADLELNPKRSNVSVGTTTSGSLYAYMTYPELNYKAEKDKCTGLITASTGTYYSLSLPMYSDYVSDDINDKYSHYTPMWLPDGLYQPATHFGGLWTPIGELTANVLQGELTTQAQMDKYGVYTNTFTINGSLYDDLYTN